MSQNEPSNPHGGGGHELAAAPFPIRHIATHLLIKYGTRPISCLGFGFVPKDPASALMIAAYHCFGRNREVDQMVVGELYAALHPGMMAAAQLDRRDLNNVRALMGRPDVLKEVWWHKISFYTPPCAALLAPLRETHPWALSWLSWSGWEE